MNRASLIGAAVLFGAFGVAPAATAPSTLTMAQLFDICGSSTVGAAAAKGDGLGWRRASHAQLEGWRSAFVAYLGGSVEIVGWRLGDGDDSLSFWMAQGPNAHKACAYSTGDPARLLDALKGRLGAPANLVRYEFGATASWSVDGIEVQFSEVGSKASVTISPAD